MNKKKDPRTEYIIVRVTKTEKKNLTEEAEINSFESLSDFIRRKLGLK